MHFYHYTIATVIKINLGYLNQWDPWYQHPFASLVTRCTHVRITAHTGATWILNTILEPQFPLVLHIHTMSCIHAAACTLAIHVAR